MPFLPLLARFATATALYLLARWLLGIGSPVTDWCTLRYWLDCVQDAWPQGRRACARLIFRLWRDLCETVGLTQIRVAQLKHDIEQGKYADDRC